MAIPVIIIVLLALTLFIVMGFQRQKESKNKPPQEK